MSLKEALERDRMQRAEAAKTEDYYRKMLEAVGMQGGQQLYKDTLGLPPEYQAMFDEFVDLCPPGAWQKCPERADQALASCGWSGDLLGAGYRGGEYVGQVKLSDGSIHIKRCRMELSWQLGTRDKLVRHRLFRNAQAAEEERVRLSGLEKAVQEAQREIDRFWQSRYGSGEYVCLTYIVSHSDYDERCNVYVFREKNVYDLATSYNRQTYAPYLKSKGEFEKWLLMHLNRFSNAPFQ